MLQQPAVFNFFHLGVTPYTKFPRIKNKKNGQKKIRWIHAPSSQLKAIQRDLLYKVLYRFAPHPCAHAYTAQKNIRSNAIEHAKFAHTIVLDIKEFFPSITEDMVRKHFIFYRDKFLANVAPGVNPRHLFCWNNTTEECVTHILDPQQDSVDLIIALCCWEGAIPQGAPTSGAISNLVMYPLDCLFEQIVVEKKMAYSRYADDLSFSSDNLDELKHFVFSYVFKKLNEAGFKINQKKVHVFNKDQRLITGLNVHPEGVRPSRKYRRILRARLANLRKEILECTTLSMLEASLEKHSYLRSEFGHIWYQMYCESYSDGVEKLAQAYFYPIRERIITFLPTFKTEPADFKANKGGLFPLLSKLDKIAPMQKEFHKLFFTRYDSKKLQGVLNQGLYGISKMEGISYREKRNLISQAISQPAVSLVSLTIPVFQNIYRVAAPEDRAKLLCLLIKGNTQKRILWQKIALYTSRLNYVARLEVLRCLANSKVMEVTGTEKFTITNHVYKMIRNLNMLDLSEFLTCSHSILRAVAQDAVRIKTSNQSFFGKPSVQPEG